MTVLIALCILLLLLYTALLLYYRLAWQDIPKFSAAAGWNPTTTVSVIIPARNEAHNLPALLASLKDQRYPKNLFEVCIIDDHSTDDTAMLVENFSSGNIRLISLEAYTFGAEINAYKKKAIEIGIQQSTGTLIVTTDADCWLPPEWLSTLVAFYEVHRPKFIAAPVSILCSNKFIEMFQAMDFMMLQGITGASVHKKIHCMCNGANMAYERAAFYEVDGFKGIDHIASGDDMLLMHKIFSVHPDKVMYLKSRDAIVQTAPVNSTREFLQQRIRWASKSDKYNDKSIFPVLLLVYLLNLLLLILLVISLFTQAEVILLGLKMPLMAFFFLCLVAKTGAELLLLTTLAKYFGKVRMLWLFPLMQPFHIVYTVVAGWLGKFGSYRWKERKVK